MPHNTEQGVNNQPEYGRGGWQAYGAVANRSRIRMNSDDQRRARRLQAARPARRLQHAQAADERTPEFRAMGPAGSAATGATPAVDRDPPRAADDARRVRQPDDP